MAKGKKAETRAEELAHRRAVTTAERKPCGGPLPDECACGCSAYEERCDYWMECYRSGVEVDDDHRCCKVRRDR